MRVVLDVMEGLNGRNMVGTVRKNKPELLSTRHAEADVSDREDKKPVIVLDYNRNKGGVDNLDKVIGTYSCRRMTARWPLVVFHKIINVSSYNAFVIWREIYPDWMPGKRNKRRAFLQELGEAAVTPFIAQRERTPPHGGMIDMVKPPGLYGTQSSLTPKVSFTQTNILAAELPVLTVTSFERIAITLARSSLLPVVLINHKLKPPLPSHLNCLLYISISTSSW